MLLRYLDFKIEKLSENEIEIENAFKCAKIVHMSSRFYHSSSEVVVKVAISVSKRREAGCVIP